MASALRAGGKNTLGEASHRVSTSLPSQVTATLLVPDMTDAEESEDGEGDMGRV